MYASGHVQDGSDLALPNEDYVPFDQSFRAGTYVVALNIINDTHVEFNEDILLNMIEPGPVLVDVATITIEHDDPPAGAVELQFLKDPPYDDTNPNPGANSFVNAVAQTMVAGENRFLVGGDFTRVNSTVRNRIARLFNDGGVDPSFEVGTGANGLVDAIAVQPDGRAVIGGGFTSVNGASRKGVARLLTDGSVDASFNPVAGVSGIVRAIGIHTNGPNTGKIVIGGDFSAVNSTNRNHIARLNADGLLDPAFDPGAGPNGPVFAAKVQLDGKIVIGGEFTAFDGVPRNRIARLNASGSLDESFDPGAGLNDTIFDLELVDTSTPVSFMRTDPGVEIPDFFQVPLDTTNGLLTVNFNFSTNADTLAIEYDGVRLIDLPPTTGVGTVSTPFSGVGTNALIIVNENGAGVGAAANWSYTATVTSFTGVEKVVAVGAFTEVDFRSRNRVARLNPDGSLDTEFKPGEGFDDTAFTVAQQSNGRLVVGGLFEDFNTTSRTNLARLLDDGTLDTSFMDTAFNQRAGPTNNSFFVKSFVNDLLVEPTGNIIIGGGFTHVGGDHGRQGVGTDVGGRLFVGTSAGATWDNLVSSPFDFQGRVPPRLRMQGGTGGTRWGIRPRQNLARIVGGETLNQRGDPGGPGNLKFIQSQYAEDENGTNAVITVERVNGSLGEVSIDVTTADGTAIAGQDYSSVFDTRTWTSRFRIRHPLRGIINEVSSGDLTNKNFRIPLLNDLLVEGNEDLALELVSPRGNQVLPDPDLILSFNPTNVLLGAALFQDGRANLVIADDDFAFGTFNFASTNYFVDENGVNAVITVDRINGSVGNVSVKYSTVAGGSATEGSDYLRVTNTLSFASGQTRRTFLVPIVNDTAVEFDETVDLLLSDPTGGAVLGTTTTATLTIRDDDFGTGSLALSTNSYRAVESDGTVPIVLRRTSGAQGTVSVTFSTSDGSGVDGLDYEGVTTNVVFGDGEIEKTVDITVLDDPDVNSDVTVNLSLSDPTGGARLGQETNAVLTIENDDFFGNLAFSAPSYFANEDSTNAVITVVRTEGSAGTVSVDFATANGAVDPAFAGSDYTSSAGTLTFMPGETIKTFIVPLINDGGLEGEETIALSLLNFVNASPGAPVNAILNIIDDESLNRPAGSDDTFFNEGEGAENFVFSVALQNDRKVVAGGSFTSFNGTSRNRLVRLNLPGSVDTTFQPGVGADNMIRDVVIQPNDQKVIIGGLFSRYNETNRNFLARINTDGQLDDTFDPGSGPDNPVLSVALNTNGLVVIGGAFSSVNGVTRNGAAVLNPDGSLNTAFDPGTGANDKVRAVAIHTNGAFNGHILMGGDFTVVDGGAMNRVARLRLDDGSVDPVFQVNFNPGITNGVVHVLKIQEDGKILVGGAFSSVNGTARQNIARLNGDGTVDTTFDPGLGFNNAVFDIAVQENGKILVGGEFTRFNGLQANRLIRLNPSGSVDPTLNTGVGANNFVSSIAIAADQKIVIGGGFTRYGGEEHNYIARLVGGNNPGAGRLEFSSAGFTSTEGSESALIEVRRVNGLLNEVSIDFASIPGGSAIEGTDFEDVQGTLTFAEGANRQQFSVPLLDDAVTDGDKTVLFRLTNPTNVTTGMADPSLLGTITNTTLNILDDDSVFNFAAESFSVSEAGSTAIVTVRRDGGTAGAVSVRFSTQDGTATSGLDYTGVTNTLVFADGEVSKTFGVPILEDLLVEGNETVALTLFNPVGSAVLGRSSVALTIIDNDFQPGVLDFAATLLTVDENAGSIPVEVVRTEGSTGTVTVDFNTSDGTAVAGEDYVATSDVLVFADGETNKAFDVFILPDFDSGETNESVILRLSNPQGGAQLGSVNVSTLEIVNNNGFIFGEFSFATNMFFVSEADGSADLEILRNGGTSGAVTVDFATAAGTADEGLDYTGVTNTVAFADGQTSASVTVPILNEFPALAEGDETVDLILFNPTGDSSLRMPTNATLTIVDDDFLPGSFSFVSEQFDVNETAGAATIEVVRTNGSSGAVSVDFETVPLTATPGEDFTLTNGTLNFADGVVTQSFDVPIIANPAQEGHFLVSLELSNPTGNASISTPSSVLRIIDNEAGAGEDDGSFDFSEGANDTVYSVAYIPSNAKLLIGGDFTAFDGVARTNAARLNPDGTLDTSFDVGSVSHLGTNATVRAVGVYTNGLNLGKFVLAGRFDRVGGTPVNNVVRLNSDGSVDGAFAGIAGANNIVHSLLIQNDGRVVLGGAFTTMNSTNQPFVARLNDDGTLDTSFNAGSGPNGVVRALAIDSSTGRIYLGGDFTSIDGVSRARIARLRVDGQVDKSFDPGQGADGSVLAVAVDRQTGKVAIGGGFTSYNGESGILRIARLLASGARDSGFGIVGEGANDEINTLSIQPDGRVIVGGGFTAFGAVTNVNRIARLTASGTLDPSFNVGQGANGFVATSVLQPDGKTVIGGGFTEINGEPRERVARLIGGENIGVGNLSFLFSNYSVDESGQNARIAVERTRALSGAVSVDFTTVDGTALAGSNYGATNGTLTFAEAEALKEFVVPIFDNSDAFGDLTVDLRLFNASNLVSNIRADAILVEPTNAVLTILDNDGIVGFERAAFSVNEDAGGATVTVVRAGGNTGPVSVQFAATDGTAVNLQDYTAVSGQLDFAPGQVSTNFVVPIFDDTKIESDETVTLTLSSIVGSAVLGQAQAEIRIIDNEFSPGFLQFSSTNSVASENGGSAQIGVIRTNGSSGLVSVDYGITNFTAEAGLDFVSVSNSLTFADGETFKTFEVPLIDDLIREGDEQAVLLLSSPSGGALLSGTGPFGTIDTNFNVGLSPLGLTRGPSSVVNAVAVDANGNAIVGGQFLSFTDASGTLTVRRIARLLSDGNLDQSFNQLGTGFDNGSVFDVAVQPDGNIIVVGSFTSYNTNTHNRIVRILPTGVVDTNFNAGAGANANGAIRAVELRADGRIVIGGDFTQYNGTNRNRVALLEPNGQLNANFDPNAGPNSTVFDVRVQPDNRVLIGGAFTSFDGTNNVGRFARLFTNGRLDTNFWANTGTGADSVVTSIDLQSDDRIVLGGNFSGINMGINGVAYDGVARINSDGTVDTSFDIGTGANFLVHKVLVQPDQRILVAGSFTLFNDVQRRRIERLNPDGSRDLTFEPCSGFNNFVNDLALQFNATNLTEVGGLIAGGGFTMYSGTNVNFLTRLLPGPAIGLSMSLLTIVDNDVDLGFSTNLITATETNGALVVNVARNGLTNQTFEVVFSTADGANPANAAIGFPDANGSTTIFDFIHTNGVLSFGPGETNKSFSVQLLEDTLIEGTEEFTIELQSTTGASLVGFTTNTVQILDNDTEADLEVLSMTAPPSSVSPVYPNDEFTYSIIVTNRGPSTLTGVSLTDTLAPEVTLVSCLPADCDTNTPGFVSFDIGTLDPNESAAVMITVRAPATTGFVTNSVSVTASEITSGAGVDVDLGNNTSTLVTAVREDQPFIAPVNATIVSESRVPANGAIDPGETVTLTLNLQNNGNQDTAGDVVATLMSGGNVTPGSPSGQNFGPLSMASEIVGRNFELTADGTNGQTVVASLMVADDGGVIPNNTVNFLFTLGSQMGGTNSTFIEILEKGPANPYPSAISIAGLTGRVSNVAVTLSNLNHSFPDDVDILLVGPTGQGVMLMSDVGGGDAVSAVDLVLDDNAPEPLPDISPLLSGNFRPANYLTRNEDPDFFPSPAPPAPYATDLNAFSGTEPNGTWSLFVVDDSQQDTGSIAGGWSLEITTSFSVSPTVGLSLTMTDGPDPVAVSSNLVYSLAVTNIGPADASSVTITNFLPPGVSVVGSQITNSQGSATVSGDRVIFDVGSLSVGANSQHQLVVTPDVAGVLTNMAVVGAAETDPFPGNNTAVALTTVEAIADLAISGSTNAVSLGNNATFTFTVTNLGPVAASSVVVDTVLPGGVTFVSATSTRGSSLVGAGSVRTTIGTMQTGEIVTVAIEVSPQSSGTFTATASVDAAQTDPDDSNNTAASSTTMVNASADLQVTATGSPNSVAEGGSVTFVIGVTNAGPSTAANVMATNLVTTGIFDASRSTEGCLLDTNGVIRCQIGSLAPGAGVAITNVITVPIVAGSIPPFDNEIGASSTTPDPDSGNNSATLTTTVFEMADIDAAGAAIVSESGGVQNGGIDPGETVTVSFALENITGLATTSVEATLQASGGVTSPSGPQNYGAIVKGDPPVAREFSFTAMGGHGDTVTATLELRDGAAVLGTVAFEFQLGNLDVFSPSGSNVEIIVPSDLANAVGAATPYPSEISVAGLAGTVSRVRVNLHGLSHSFPDDIDMLLVAPDGQGSVVLISDVGGGVAFDDLDLVIDDGAASSLPDEHQPAVTSGNYRPTDFEAGDSFPSVNLADPPAATLASLAGINPNGTWQLFVVDDQNGDSGILAGGWSLELATVATLNPAANLVLTASSSPISIFTGETVTNTIVLENLGPSEASNIQLLSSWNLTAASSEVAISAGSSDAGVPGRIAGTIASLASGARLTNTYVLTLSEMGTLTNTITVSSDEIELDGSNNLVELLTTVDGVALNTMGAGMSPEGGFMLQLSGREGMTYVIEASPDLIEWTPVYTNVTLSGALDYIDMQAEAEQKRFYRASER